VAGGPHGEPREPIRIVITAGEGIEGALKPFPRIRKFRLVLCRDFRSYLETALADSRPEYGDHVSRACPKFHLHASKRFFGDALERAAPAGMNGSDRMTLFVSEENRNAISYLHCQEKPGLVCNQSICFGGLRRRFGVGGIRDTNDVRMNLTQAYLAHSTRVQGREEIPAILQNVLAGVPFGETKIQNLFGSLTALVIAF